MSYEEKFVPTADEKFVDTETEKWRLGVGAGRMGWKLDIWYVRGGYNRCPSRYPVTDQAIYDVRKPMRIYDEQ
jgi:hypothetical protein